jgi:ribonuclease BN (tRNA processing enzyme)
MRVTILGCQSPYPGPGGATPGYLVEHNSLSILLDCGSGVVSQLGKYMPLYQLDAVILSHYHHDHCADLGVLQYGIMVHQLSGQREKEKPLPIYAPRLPQPKSDALTYRDATRFHAIDEQTRLTIGGIQISFLRTDHGNGDPCYAMKLQADGKTLVYGADSGPGTTWQGFAEQADLFICEGTFLERNKPANPNGHLTVRQAAAVAEQLQCRALLITHLFPAYQEDEVLAEATGFTRGICHVARVGWSMDLV